MGSTVADMPVGLGQVIGGSIPQSTRAFQRMKVTLMTLTLSNVITTCHVVMTCPKIGNAAGPCTTRKNADACIPASPAAFCWTRPDCVQTAIKQPAGTTEQCSSYQY